MEILAGSGVVQIFFWIEDARHAPVQTLGSAGRSNSLYIDAFKTLVESMHVI